MQQGPSHFPTLNPDAKSKHKTVCYYIYVKVKFFILHHFRHDVQHKMAFSQQIQNTKHIFFIIKRQINICVAPFWDFGSGTYQLFISQHYGA